MKNPYLYMYNSIEAYTHTPIGTVLEKRSFVLKPFRERLMKPLEHLLELGGIRKDITLLVLSGIAVVLSLAGVQPLPFDIAWVAILLCGVPIILEAIIGLVTAFDIKADVLVSLALIASVCIGETFAAGEVAFIMQLGGLLEELTVAKARAGIEKLVHLTPQTARVLKNGKETVVPAEQVQVGDVLLVLPGETVPVDGVITAGQTSIKLNLAFSMTLNFIAITLAITGILNPVVGALVHNAGSVLVIINSALLLNRKRC